MIQISKYIRTIFSFKYLEAAIKLKYEGKDLEAMSFARNYHAWIASEFKAFTGVRVAEVGAGTGNFTELLLTTTRCNIDAFEPSENLTSIFLERFSSNQRCRLHCDIFDGKRFISTYDTIFYVNVLEHIQDDIEEIKRAHMALVSGGRLCIFVPALEFLYSDLDRTVGHYRRYSRLDLKNKLSSAGFEIEEIKYFDFLGILPWYMNFVLLKNTISGGNVHLYDKYIVPITRSLESLISPPLGKNLIAICRKND